MWTHYIEIFIKFCHSFFAVYGKRVISRSCFYEDVDDPADKCAMDTTSSYMKTVYCRTCTTDGCNAAGGLSAWLGLLLLPLLAALRQLCKWGSPEGWRSRERRLHLITASSKLNFEFEITKILRAGRRIKFWISFPSDRAVFLTFSIFLVTLGSIHKELHNSQSHSLYIYHTLP